MSHYRNQGVKGFPHYNFHISIHMKMQSTFASLINPCEVCSAFIGHMVKTACRHFVAAAVVMAAGLAAVAGEFAGNKGLPRILQIW